MILGLSWMKYVAMSSSGGGGDIKAWQNLWLFSRMTCALVPGSAILESNLKEVGSEEVGT